MRLRSWMMGWWWWWCDSGDSRRTFECSHTRPFTAHDKLENTQRNPHPPTVRATNKRLRTCRGSGNDEVKYVVACKSVNADWAHHMADEMYSIAYILAIYSIWFEMCSPLYDAQCADCSERHLHRMARLDSIGILSDRTCVYKGCVTSKLDLPALMRTAMVFFRCWCRWQKNIDTQQ